MLPFRAMTLAALVGAGIIATGCSGSLAAASSAANQHVVQREPPDAVARAVGSVAEAMIRLSRPGYDDPRLGGYVTEVGARVAAGARKPDGPFEFTVLDDTEVNAWSIPGNRVFVSRATLAVLGSEAELASVMGHEIAHQDLRHSMQSFRASMLGLDDLSCGSSLDGAQEHQADRLGLTLLIRAGYDPSAMFRMLRALYASPERAIDPGSQTEGVARVARLARALEERRGGKTGRERYLERIEGLVWGPDPGNGVVRKDGWECARCGFALQLPKGWRLEGAPLSVTASSPRGDGKLEVDGWPLLQSFPLANTALAMVQSQEFEQREVAGMTAYVASRNSSEGTIRLALLAGRDRVWRLQGTGSGASRLDAALGSMRPFGAADLQELPARIRVRKAQRSSSIRELASGLCEGKAPERTIGWLNGRELEEQVAEGTLVKCIGP